MAQPGELWASIEAKVAELEARSAAERRRNAQLLLLNSLEFQYTHGRNPLCVWYAWEICHRGGHPLPDWIAQYFNEFYRTLRSWVERPPSGELAAEVGAALGFKAVKKDANPLTLWREMLEGERWLYVYEEYVNAGLSAKASRQKVADQFATTEPTVRRRLGAFAANRGQTLDDILAMRAQFRKEVGG